MTLLILVLWAGLAVLYVSNRRAAVLVYLLALPSFPFYWTPFYIAPFNALSVQRLLRPLYRAAAFRGAAARLLPAPLRPRIVAYQPNGQPDLGLMLGSRIIGRYDAVQSRWTIRFPLWLIVDLHLLSSDVDRGRMPALKNQ
ncbi:MAG: hypothetical protein M1132_07020 [Chloroflexi bacterium]|nr:hypothetical protein [Chloroflexota bacterium]